MKRALSCVKRCFGRWVGVGGDADDDVVEVRPPSPLVLLPIDVWNGTLCKYLQVRHYVDLYLTGDSALRTLINTLTPNSMVIGLLDDYPLILRLFQRTRVNATLMELAIPSSFFSEGKAVLSTNAMSLQLSKDFQANVDYSACPNLVSLELIDVCTVDGSMRVDELVKSLPRTLTEFRARDSAPIWWKSVVTLTSAVSLARCISDCLPNLTVLDIALPLIGPMENEVCHWPVNLTALGLCVSKSPSLPIDFNYPQSLTSLKLSLRSATNVVTITSSSLPSTLMTLVAGSITVIYDSPLPADLTTLVCRALAPGYNERMPLAFLLPPSITRLWPLPPIEQMRQHCAPIRILMHCDRADVNLLPMSASDVKEWIAYEQASADLSQLAFGFIGPRAFDFNRRKVNRFAVPKDMMDTFARRLGKTVYCLMGVDRRKLVGSVLRHCKWLMQLTLSTPSASEAFLSYAVKAASSCGRQRMPHLLFRLSMDLRSDKFVTHLRDASVANQMPLIGTIRDLQLKMNMHHLVKSDFGLLIARVFPNLATLRLVEIDVPKMGYMLGPEDLCAMLTALPQLRLFCARMRANASYLTFAPEGFVGRMPRHIRRVEWSVDGAEPAVRNLV